MTTKATTDNQTQRASHLKWVPIGEMRVSPRSQREFRQAHADKFAADFDLEGFGFPVVNQRDGHYFIVDGQHRIAALRMLGFDDDQQIQCECYVGLSESEEAELFLRRDDRKAIAAFDKFRIALTAGRDVETDVDRLVRVNGLVISRDKIPGGIRSTGTLCKIYRRSDPETLARTLRLIRDAFGDSGFEAPVLDGLSLVCQRYNGQVDDASAVVKLSKVNGGVNGLLGHAERLRKATGNAKGHCVAAAAVEIIRTGSNGKKLPSWWK